MTNPNPNLVELETTSNTSSQNNEDLSPRQIQNGHMDSVHVDASNIGDNSPNALRASMRGFHKDPVSQRDTDSELIEKTSHLAQELSQLQDLTDQLRQERESLQEAIKEKDEQLIATTVELETESDTLSNARRELREKRNEVLILQRKNQTMDEMSSLNRLTAERQNMRESRDRTNVTLLDDDSMQKIIDLTNEKRMKLQHIEDLKHEIETLHEVLQKKVSAIESLDTQIKDYQWKEDRAYELECTNNELNYQVENLQKEIKTLEQITRMKTHTIEKLNHQLSQWKDLEEDHKATQKVLDYKQQELDMLNADLEHVQSENAEKEEEIERILNNRDLVPIKTLQSDKVFLRTEMKKKQDQKTTLEKTIKWQEKQIHMLQSRLQSLNFALKETKMLRSVKKVAPKSARRAAPGSEERPDSDQVPIHLYLLMVYNLQTIEKRMKNLQLLLDEKDVIAESLESKIEDYEQEKVEETKSYKKEAQELRRKIEQVHQQIAQSEELYKSEENQLKAKNISIKKRLFSMHPRPSSSGRV